MYYALLYFIPALVVMGIAKLFFHFKYTWKEFAIQLGVTLVVLVGLFAAASSFQTHDEQIVNGVITQTEAKRQDCPWGWRKFRDGFCTEYRTRQVYSHTTCTGTGTSKSCTKHYDTEYNYIYEWEKRYFAYSDIDKTFEISRVDRQGATTPERFAEIEVGDPVSATQSYTNYIKGAADSLFAKDDPVEPVPIAYPTVRDYYKANRVIFSNTAADSELFKSWNRSLAELNSRIRETGGNAIVVITDSVYKDFPEALARNWDAHNINDIVTVIGRDGDDIKWVDVRGWSGNSLVNVEIENEILNHGKLDSDKINAIIETAMMENFELKSMDDFEYLADDIHPPMWVQILAMIILLLVTPLVTYYFHKYDIA